jgi:hypothetical protein
MQSFVLFNKLYKLKYKLGFFCLSRNKYFPNFDNIYFFKYFSIFFILSSILYENNNILSEFWSISLFIFITNIKNATFTPFAVDSNSFKVLIRILEDVCNIENCFNPSWNSSFHFSLSFGISFWSNGLVIKLDKF